MKNLILVRHAKSSWDMEGLRDHDRPLNKRGERDAPNMGDALRQRGIKPDVIYSSTALRAITTAEAIAEKLGYSRSQIVTERDIYLADPRKMLGLIQRFNESAGTAMIFGHNPGMHDLANLLCREGEVEGFPTLGVARIELPVDYWGEVDWSCGLLLEVLTPKKLKKDS